MWEETVLRTFLDTHYQNIRDLESAKAQLAALEAQKLTAYKYDSFHAGGTASDRVGSLVILIDEKEKEIRQLEKVLNSSSKKVMQLSKHIPDNQTKIVFQLRYFVGESFSEIAETFGITEECVKMRLYRFLQANEKKERP